MEKCSLGFSWFLGSRAFFIYKVDVGFVRMFCTVEIRLRLYSIIARGLV